MLTQIFSGAISNMNKPDLIKIANALGIDPSGDMHDMHPGLKSFNLQSTSL